MDHEAKAKDLFGHHAWPPDLRAWLKSEVIPKVAQALREAYERGKKERGPNASTTQPETKSGDCKS